MSIVVYLHPEKETEEVQNKLARVCTYVRTSVLNKEKTQAVEAVETGIVEDTTYVGISPSMRRNVVILFEEVSTLSNFHSNTYVRKQTWPSGCCRLMNECVRTL